MMQVCFIRPSSMLQEAPRHTQLPSPNENENEPVSYVLLFSLCPVVQPVRTQVQPSHQPADIRLSKFISQKLLHYQHNQSNNPSTKQQAADLNNSPSFRSFNKFSTDHILSYLRTCNHSGLCENF
jgi:hypothetical protein